MAEPSQLVATDLQFGGPGAPPQPWIVRGGSISYDGAVLVPNNVPGGQMGPGTLNVNALYVKGIQFINPVGLYLPLSGGTLTGNLTFLNVGNLKLPGGSSGQFLVTDGSSNLSWSATVPGGPYLALSGGSLTGPLVLQNPSYLSMGGGTAGQFLSTNGSGVLSWADVTSSGGASVSIGDTPPASPSSGNLWYDSVGGQLYIYYHDSDSSQWVITVNQNNSAQIFVGDNPPASPIAGNLWWDSAGGQLYIRYNDGNSSQWVIANSLLGAYLPLAGGTLTGSLTLAADPTVALQASTKQYVDNNTGYGGFVNKLRNGAFDIWQRGASVAISTATATYTADGWLITVNGAGVTVIASAGRPGGPFNCLSFTGAAGTTTWNIRQYIESYVSAPLCGQTCTLSFWMATNLAGGFTPQLQVFHPTAADNWTSTVTDLTVNLQPIPGTQTWTRVSYTFTAPAAAQSLGLGILVFSNTNIGANRVWISEMDLRATPGVPIGLNANPPPPELRPFPIELTFCQRYFYTGTSYTGGTFFGGSVTSGAAYWATRSFPVQMRAIPTITFSSPSSGTGFPATAGTVNAVNTYGVQEARTANATAVAAWYSSNISASAEL